MGSQNGSFSSVRAYLHALSQTPARLARRAGSVSTSYEEMSRVRSRSGAEMAKTLRWTDLIGFGLGGMVGAGVFVTTGHASRVYAGPAIILSYAIAGVCALLSAFCYTEFAVDMPVAGGAFSYLRVTFGEFAAFLTGANLIMEYVMSNAAVARSFTGYFSSGIGISSTGLRITVPGLPKGFNEIDLVAVAVVLILTLLICHSTRESSAMNMTMTTVHILFILFIILIGFSKGDWKNFTKPGDPNHPSGFFPYGAAGVFNGAAMVYLSYIGYDAVSTLAEEVKNPVKDIPIGVSGSVILVTILYCLMAASMCMLLPYDMIIEDAPFSGAFSNEKGWPWVSNVIGMGASLGILTSLLVAMLGQARYLCVIGRSRVIPQWFARVHPVTSTPINASASLGILTAALALFMDLDILLDLVCIGTFFVFYMVANAVIYRRYVPSTSRTTTNGGSHIHIHNSNNHDNDNTITSTMSKNSPWPTISFLTSFSLTALLFTLVWKLCPNGKPKIVMLSAFGAIALAILQLFHCTVPQARKPEFWGVPLMPHIPCASIFLNVFLLGSLRGRSYVRFGVFSAIVVAVYLLYSVHASYDAEENGTINPKNSDFVGDEESADKEVGGGGLNFQRV